MDNGGKEIRETILVDVSLIDEHPDNEYLFGIPRKGIESLKDIMMHTGKPVCDAPILLWDTGDGRYTVYSGHMRRRAFMEAGGKMIPAIVYAFPEKEPDRRRAVLGANLYGRNVTAVDVKNSFYVTRQVAYMRDTLKMEGFKGDMRAELAKEFRTNRSTVHSYLAISKLPESVKERMRDGRISYSIARNMTGMSETAIQKVLSICDSAAREGKMISCKDMEHIISEERRREKSGAGGIGSCREELHTQAIDRRIESLADALVEWEGTGYWNPGYMRRRFRRLMDMVGCELDTLQAGCKKKV